MKYYIQSSPFSVRRYNKAGLAQRWNGSEWIPQACPESCCIRTGDACLTVWEFNKRYPMIPTAINALTPAKKTA